MPSDTNNLARRSQQSKPPADKKSATASQSASEPAIFELRMIREQSFLEIGRCARLMHVYCESIMLGVEIGDIRVIRTAFDGVKENAREIAKLEKDIGQ